MLDFWISKFSKNITIFFSVSKSQELAHFKLSTQKLILASGLQSANRDEDDGEEVAVGDGEENRKSCKRLWIFRLTKCPNPFVFLSVASHSFSDCNISLPLRFVCCILLSDGTEVFP